jgi:hypothetical protein
MNTPVKDVTTTWVIWVKKDATFREMAAALRGPFPPDQAPAPVVLPCFARPREGPAGRWLEVETHHTAGSPPAARRISRPRGIARPEAGTGEGSEEPSSPGIFD